MTHPTVQNVTEASATVIALGAIHLTGPQLFEGFGLLCGMAFVFFLRESVPFRKRLYYAAGSVAAGLIFTHAGAAVLATNWPSMPGEMRVAIAFLSVLCAMPLVTLWRGAWRAAASEPGNFVDMITGLVRRIFNLPPRSGGGR
ncbi:hypothetical protein [Oceanicaulis sp. MMSF_3324]|uniref:hypothetical protein n=1 Tax=Oceanicaulis sp. MMSF_3324 TaxID=3046702 RepID=UPI00273D551E|nr:hypothetical protein [Oceanicaulis sp. MMSF_3324]